VRVATTPGTRGPHRAPPGCSPRSLSLPAATAAGDPAARPHRRTDLGEGLLPTYGLTEREQQLTRLVLQCYSTLDIADHLVISVHTVQGHLKNIFTKTGVRARRDLVTKIFFAHYEPRLRDNEQRTAANLPLRAGRLVPPARTAAPGQARAEPAAT
jgi:DNA-binding CsgD family transcriptional regulator